MTTFSEFDVKSLVNDFGRHHDIREKFMDRSLSDAERFELVDTFMSTRHRFLELPNEDPDGKSSEKSIAYRTRGNVCVAKKDFDGALDAYNKSLLYAPWPAADDDDTPSSQDGPLALAFGNRSAVLFHRQRFAECVADVEQAHKLPLRPQTWKKLAVRKVKALMAAGRARDAERFMKSESAQLGIRGGNNEVRLNAEEEKDWIELLDRVLAEVGSKRDSESAEPELKFKRPGIAEARVKLEQEYLLKNGPHAVFPAASSSLRLEYSHKFGRHFVADSDISVGDVIMKEPPFVNSLKPSFTRTNCHSCSIWTDSPIPCKHCTNVVYCSWDCAKGPASVAHEKECPFLWLFVATTSMPTAFQEKWCAEAVMVIRTLLKKTLEEWEAFMSTYPGNLSGEADGFSVIPKSTYLTADYENVFCLLKSSWTRPRELLCYSAFHATYVMKVFKTVSAPVKPHVWNFVGGLALRHMLSYAINSESIFDFNDPEPDGAGDSVTWTGFAIHPTLSLLNGSCDPNVGLTFVGEHAVVRVIHPIKKGEPVVRCTFVSYANMRKQQRLDTIRKTLFYECMCRACEEDWPLMFSSLGVLRHGLPCLPNILCSECSRVVPTPTDAILVCSGCGTYLDRKPIFEKRAKLWKVLQDGRRATIAEVFEATEEAWKIIPEPSRILLLLGAAVYSVCKAQGNKRYIRLPPGNDLTDVQAVRVEILK